MIALLLALLAQAGAPAAAPSEGTRLFRRCVACHALSPGRNTPAGPNLHGVVGRRIAAQPGFRYSPALQAYGREHPRWTPELLDRFLADPEAAVPGTEMGFPGLSSLAERQTLIRWLARPDARID